MKKIVGLCLVVLMSTASLFAQDGRRGQRDFDPTERIEKTIRDLNLNDDQAAQYRAIEKEYADRWKTDRERMDGNREDREQMRADMEKRREEMERMQNEKHERVKQILTDDQYKRYLENQRSMQGPRGDRKR
ncbi:MAG: DUF4890 domain-containing protein [Tannerellaceae bacterium]|nr:DUF4890 domain-containing protein [Tannerellaceae bacterium]